MIDVFEKVLSYYKKVINSKGKIYIKLANDFLEKVKTPIFSDKDKDIKNGKKY